MSSSEQNSKSGILFVPYGAATRGAGLALLISRYIVDKELGEIAPLGCNGCVSLCGRDEITSFRRTLSTCFSCSSDQLEAMQFVAGQPEVSSRSLGEWIKPSDIEASRALTSDGRDSLRKLEVDGVQISKLVEQAFLERSGHSIHDDRLSSYDEQLARRLCMASIRVMAGVKACLKDMNPGFIIIEGGKEYLAASASAAAAMTGTKVLNVAWDRQERSVCMWTSENDKKWCPFIVDDLKSMRADTSTWPDELIDAARDGSQLLGLANG